VLSAESEAIGEDMAHPWLHRLAHVQISEVIDPIIDLLLNVERGKFLLRGLLPSFVFGDQAFVVGDCGDRLVVLRSVRDSNETPQIHELLHALLLGVTFVVGPRSKRGVRIPLVARIGVVGHKHVEFGRTSQSEESLKVLLVQLHRSRSEIVGDPGE
jgi:hypothetical protein